MYGVDKNDVTFHEITDFQNKFPASYYYTNALKGGIVAEGISSLIDGKHFKILCMSHRSKMKLRAGYSLS